MQSIPYTDFGGTGETILFLHANGFPPKSYKNLINTLTKKFNVIGLEQRPLWPHSNPNDLKSWDLFSNDLIQFIDQNDLSPIKCVGHSLGAVVSVMAAHNKPNLFSQLVLIEPVLFSKFIPFIAGLFPPKFARNIVPISRIALKRRSKWASETEIYQSYRQKKIFKRISDLNLKNLVEASTFVDENGDLRLRYPKLWEAQVYAIVEYIIDKILNSELPISIARGSSTDVISEKVWTNLKDQIPKKRLLNVEDASHLLPFEKPIMVGDWVLDQFT